MRGLVKFSLFLIDKCNCDIRSRDAIGRTCLHYAAASGNISLLQYLVKSYDPSIVDNKGNSSLHSCLKGYIEKALLMKQRCHWESQSKSSSLELFPLKQVSQEQHLLAIKFLLTLCTPNNANSDGVTPLHLACATGDTQLVEYLIEDRGCDKNVKDKEGRSCLHYAASSRNIKTIQYLVLTQQLNSTVDFRGNTPLHSCVYGIDEVGTIDIASDHLEKLSAIRFLAMICHINSTNQLNNTALHYACEKGDIVLVKCLIEECKCDETIRGEEGRTCLHFAAVNGNEKLIQYLVTERGFDPTAQTDCGDIPLHFCVNHTFDELEVRRFEANFFPQIMNTHETPRPTIISATTFLSTKCNVNATNNHKRTPLGVACSSGDLPIVRCLVEKCGCTVDESYVHVACEKENISVVRYLIEDCRVRINSNMQVHFSVLHGHLSVVKYFKEKLSYDLNIKNNQGQAPLHVACLEGNIDVVRYLVEECLVNFNSRDNDGDTPLSIAVENGHLNIVECLIKQGCDPMQRDNNGNTPVHLAAYNGHLAIVKYFKEQLKCDLNATNYQEQLPIHAACEEGELEIVQYLIGECVTNVEDSDRDITLQNLPGNKTKMVILLYI